MAHVALAEGAWSSALVTGATYVYIQNVGPKLLLVSAQPDSSAAAPTTQDAGFVVGPGQLLPLVGLAAHTLYVRAPAGKTSYELLTDGT